MAKNKVKRRKKFFSPGFVIFLLLYIILLCAAAYKGLTFFVEYIDAYEQTRPSTALNAYLDNLDRAYLGEHASAFLDSLDGKVQSREESLDRIYAVIQDTSCVRQYDPDGNYVYRLKDGDTVYDTVKFVPGGEEIMGFTGWVVAEETFDFDMLCHYTELTVPNNYTVICGGYPLDEGHILQDGIEFQFLSEFYGSYELPTMVTYRTGRYVGDVDLQILDPNGDPVDPSLLSEDYFTGTCTEEEMAQISDFLEKYMNLYVTYFSGLAYGDINSNYYALSKLVVKGSDLQTRLKSAYDGLTWVHNKSTLQSVTLNSAMNVGNGMYVCSVSYQVETWGVNGSVLTDTNTKFLLCQTDSGLLAESQMFI